MGVLPTGRLIPGGRGAGCGAIAGRPRCWLDMLPADVLVVRGSRGRKLPARLLVSRAESTQIASRAPLGGSCRSAGCQLGCWSAGRSRSAMTVAWPSGDVSSGLGACCLWARVPTALARFGRRTRPLLGARCRFGRWHRTVPPGARRESSSPSPAGDAGGAPRQSGRWRGGRGGGRRTAHERQFGGRCGSEPDAVRRRTSESSPRWRSCRCAAAIGPFRAGEIMPMRGRRRAIRAGRAADARPRSGSARRQRPGRPPP